MRLAIPFRDISPVILPIAGSALLWAVVFFSIPASEQEFPLNDDWAFARGALLFARGEGIHYSGWASMPQLGQWLWALPFVAVFGPSHVALRLSTIALSWIGLVAFYDLLRHEGLPKGRAALVVAALAFNPLFFLLAGTYMTDVPALSMALAALAFYRRALAGGRLGALALGTSVATLAALTRQNTLVVPIVTAILLARERPLRKRPAWWIAIALPLVIGIAVHLWFQGRPDTRAIAPQWPETDVLLLLPFLLGHFFGLYALPLLVAGGGRGRFRAFGIGALLMLGAAIFWHGPGDKYLPYGGLFPYSENMITPWGAFAGSRFTGALEVGKRPLILGTDARWVLTILGCVAGAGWLSRAFERERLRLLAGALGLFTLLELPFLLIAPDLYDRYLLLLLPGALCLAAPIGDAGRLRRLLAAGVLTLMAIVSLALMHDWLAWNSARWKLGERALTAGINPWDIEGGFEWDGWFSPAPRRDPRGPRRGLTLPFTHDWFPHVTGRYAIAFSQPPGTVCLDRQEYHLWLSPGQHEMLLVQIGAAPGK